MPPLRQRLNRLLGRLDELPVAPVTPDTPHLSVEHLGWNADGNTILRDISFTLPRGSFTGLLGPNGSGKSSLLRCIYRFHRPARGRVLLDGRDIWQHGARSHARQVAVVLQESPAEFGLRLHEVIRMGLTPHKGLFEPDSDADRHSIEQVLRRVDLDHKVHQPFGSLSGGERQRGMLARAMVQRPRLLIMDEPTNHLDVHYQVEMLQLARSLGVTVLASIHDLNLASAFCDHLLLLQRGQLVAQGAVSEVLTGEQVERTFAVSAHIDRHPNRDHPRITFNY